MMDGLKDGLKDGWMDSVSLRCGFGGKSDG